MNIQHLDYILMLAQEKSFSKAAKKLFMSQSALSQFVQKQEKQLGISLFNRGNNPIQLTPEGELYVQALRKIKMDMMDFDRQLTDLTELRTGKLVIGTSAFRATCLLPQVIRDFTSAYPGIELKIITNHMNELKNGLTSGAIDFCIENDYFDKKNFYCENLYSETHYLAVPKDHPVQSVLGTENALTFDDISNETKKFFTAKPVSLNQCGDIKIIGVKPENSFYQCHLELFKEAGVTPNNFTTVDNIDTAFRWVGIGMGASIIPDSLILHGDFKHHPNYYKLDLVHASQEIVFAMRSDRYMPVAAKKFLEMLRQLIGFGTWGSGTK